MGTEKLIILFIGFLLVTSCSREIGIAPQEQNPEGKVPVSIRFFMEESSKTRSSGWEYDNFFPDPDIIEKEKFISNIFLVVFKNIIFEECAYYDENDFKQDPDDFSVLLENSETDEGLLDLEPGPHYFYAILNIPDELRLFLVSKLEGKEGILTKDEFERTVLTDISLDYLTKGEAGFIMTNSAPPEMKGVYTIEQITNSQGAYTNLIELEIGRAVGKISFAYVASEVQTGELHGNLSNIRYKILNNPSQMYIMPVIENNILLTPHYNNTSYPANYFSPWIKDANILDNTAQSPWLTATTTQSFENGDELAYGYCIENHNRLPLKSTSTMLLIEAKFTPAVWLNGDGTVGSESDDGTFYRIAQYNTATPAAHYGYLQGYYKEPPDAVLTGLMAGGTPTGGPYKIIPYEKGITYYGFWLSYNNLFQVKRNNYFKIAITHIHGAGEPTPGGVIDPDTDPDEEGTRGRLVPIIVSWIEDNRIVTLGETPDDTPGTDTDVKEWEDGNGQDETLGGNNQFD